MDYNYIEKLLQYLKKVPDTQTVIVTTRRQLVHLCMIMNGRKDISAGFELTFSDDYNIISKRNIPASPISNSRLWPKI